MIQLSQRLITEINDSFPRLSRKGESTYRIKFCGNYVTTYSGKTVWRTKGYAKAAFQQHLGNIFLDEFGIDYRNRKELLPLLEKEGYLEFVEFSYEG